MSDWSAPQVSSLLLWLAFAYDIFWVFLSPYFFNGESVMVVVRAPVSCILIALSKLSAIH
jgi:hypothetical protein